MQHRQSTTYTDGIRQSNDNNKDAAKNINDEDDELSLELMDILTNLQNDPDRDVLEAVEETDHMLL
jgi:seryl-tRNA synthetase